MVLSMPIAQSPPSPIWIRPPAPNTPAQAAGLKVTNAQQLALNKSLQQAGPAGAAFAVHGPKPANQRWNHFFRDVIAQITDDAGGSDTQTVTITIRRIPTSSSAIRCSLVWGCGQGSFAEMTSMARRNFVRKRNLAINPRFYGTNL